MLLLTSAQVNRILLLEFRRGSKMSVSVYVCASVCCGRSPHFLCIFCNYIGSSSYALVSFCRCDGVQKYIGYFAVLYLYCTHVMVRCSFVEMPTWESDGNNCQLSGSKFFFTGFSGRLNSSGWKLRKTHGCMGNWYCCSMIPYCIGGKWQDTKKAVCIGWTRRSASSRVG